MSPCKRPKLLEFVVLGEAESPYALINATASRFYLLPKYLVYDHGCGVASCAAAAAPWILAETTLMTDRLHVVGHSCTETTKPSAFPSLRGANSVSHEQRNSPINVITSSLRRSAQGTYLATLQVQQAVLSLIATAREANARDDADFESFYFFKVLEGGCFCCRFRPRTDQLGLSVPSTGGGEIFLPTLAQDQVQAVEEQLERARWLGGDEHEFRVLDHGALFCKDVTHLTPGCWLCDNLIDVYFLVLEKGTTGRRVSAFFIPFVHEAHGHETRRGRFWPRGVSIFHGRQLGRSEGKDNKSGIMANCLVLVPINVDQHWALVCIDVSARVITCLDSYIGLRGGREKGVAVLQNMMNLLADAGGLTVAHILRWRSVAAGHDVSQQENSDDFDVFTSVFGRCIVRGESLAFKATNSKAIRQLTAFELMTGSLI
jgi:Ulp1 protease family, C-terminal catalytic domain